MTEFAVNPVKDALDELVNKWKIDPRIYDLHIGARDDVVDTQVTVNGVIFHIPTLSKENQFVLWKCLWPDCHNCCERQGRLPLTKDDIKVIATRLRYDSVTNFLKNETRISSWNEQQSFGSLITTISMISLKRQNTERDEDDGKPLRCRFLDGAGCCSIHPDKPGVCWMYPFASWLESTAKGMPIAHASFQLTGDCPGFYLDSSLDSALPMLREYSKKIYDYNMSVSRTTRENFGFVNIHG